MKAVTGQALGLSLVDQLGLDPALVVEVVLHMPPGELACVEVHMLATEHTEEFVGNLTKRYVLVEQTEVPS